MLEATPVLRKMATCVLAIMLTATMLWGGCLSCANYFMVPSISAGDCCAPTGHCKEKNKPTTPSSQGECWIQAVAPAKAGPLVPHAPVLFSNLIPLTVPLTAFAVTTAHGAFAQDFRTDNFSPPDLYLLHSVFRI
jgi:hypothetical protein